MRLTYTTKLMFDSDSDRGKIIDVLSAQQKAYNECSKVKFSISNNSIVELHNKFYKQFRECQPEIPSQVVIAAENECLSAYRSIKSNKHKIDEPIKKKKLSIRLDKRTYSFKNNRFSIISLGKRIKCGIHLYPKLSSFMKEYDFCDPLLYIKDNEVRMALSFDIPTKKVNESSACGIDLGIRMAAVTSEGKFFQDKKFNKEKRKLRYLKRQLQSCGSKSAKKHLRKKRQKEHNKNTNQTYKLAHAILQNTKANIIVLEDLSKIKRKRNKYQNKNRISQVPFYKLKYILTYKAPFYGKTVKCVSPKDTSQIDHRTGKKNGIRKGRRYYSKDSVVLDADSNASVNIAKRSKHPVSYVSVLDGQAVVNRPIACKP